MKTESEANQAIDLYADMVRRICFLYLRNASDVEDVFQDVFLKYVLSDRRFASEAHEKAWMIRVAINACKDVLKSAFRKRVVSLDALPLEPAFVPETDKELTEAIRILPDHYKSVVYLFYYEGYSAIEIAKILGQKANTIYTWLRRARQVLKQTLGDEPDGR